MENALEERNGIEAGRETDGGMYFWAAVWKAEKKKRITSEDTGGTRTVCCCMFKGQPGAIFERELTEGRYFTQGGAEVCLLDQSTVRQIFGSDKVSGLSVQIDGKSFQIAGVLKGGAPVCVIPAEETTAFDGIAVRKNEAGCSSDQAFNMLETAYLDVRKSRRVTGSYIVLQPGFCIRAQP